MIRVGVFGAAVKDPLTGLPFANNTIPQSRIDPYAAAILALVPLPNQPGRLFEPGALVVAQAEGTAWTTLGPLAPPDLAA